MITFLSIVVLVSIGMLIIAIVLDNHLTKETERHMGINKPNPLNSTIRQYERSKH